MNARSFTEMTPTSRKAQLPLSSAECGHTAWTRTHAAACIILKHLPGEPQAPSATIFLFLPGSLVSSLWNSATGFLAPSSSHGDVS